MNENDLGDLLAASAAEVLESMFFASTEEAPASEEGPGDRISAGLTFRGEPSGVFRVGISRPAAKALSGAFLGLEESEVSPKQTGEVVCELTNMICGSTLSRLEARNAFELDGPRLTEGPVPSGATHRTLGLEQGTLTVYMGFSVAA